MATRSLTSPTGMKIYFVRHAHADWAADESRPLSESGRAAAATIAGLLSAFPVSAIYSSPARRSIQTVELLAQRLGVRVDVVPELRERHLPVVPVGDFERIVREAWRFPTYVPGDGESNAVAQTRGLAAVQQIIKRHAGQHVVAATHGNLLALILNGFDPSFGYEFWRELSFPDVYEVEFEATRLIRVRRIWEKAAGLQLTLDRVPGSYAICRLPPGDPLPPWVVQGGFFSVTRTPSELSIVRDVGAVPSGVTAEGPWLMLAVRGPLDLNITGVLAGLATPLATAGISIFAVSTYDTDYVLVRNHDMDRAVRVLREAGHNVSEDAGTSR